MKGAMIQMASERTVLGTHVATEAFQLFRLLGFDSLAEALGVEGAERDDMQYMAGMAMGRALVRRGTVAAGPLPYVLDSFRQFYRRMEMGLIYFHHHADGALAVGIEECAGCFGAEPVGRPICFVEAGMICGVVSEATGQAFRIEEVKCIGGMGDHACEFELRQE